MNTIAASNAEVDSMEGRLEVVAFEDCSTPSMTGWRRSRTKRLLHLIRRGHLYAGLFMLPWVILYGITAFLFNHPTAFADHPTMSFGRAEWAGTSMESPLAASDLASNVVEALRQRNPNSSYVLVEPVKARFTREFAQTTIAADDKEISISIDPSGNGGPIRIRPAPRTQAAEKAPFTIGRDGGAGQRAKRSKANNAERELNTSGGRDLLKLDRPIDERIKEAVPALLDRMGLPKGEIVVVSVPEVTFSMLADEKLWIVTCNPQTGSVSGRAPISDAEEISTRRFLTRLHLTHSYPFESNARWGWALIVDFMAVIMVFWGISGMLMWWQIKATRRLGAGVLMVSALTAVMIGLAMHDHLSIVSVGR